MESLPPRKLALILEYDGTRYHGFQFQPDAPTIQGDIEHAVAKLTGERIRVVGAGRTDAGVHARGQVVSFSSFSTLPPETFLRALNAYVRPDIAVKAIYEVADDFDARRDALSREYRYRILNGPTPSPLELKYTHFVPLALDIDAMNQACKSLVGVHDFASFTGPTGRGTVREVYRAEVSREGEIVVFDMAANAFLNKQVRCTVGSMIKVGLGRQTVGEFQEIMQARKPALASPVAPPQGLFLMRVNYPDSKFGEGQSNENL
jgi:tRNA pseudouridine38-40 synthase